LQTAGKFTDGRENSRLRDLAARWGGARKWVGKSSIRGWHFPAEREVDRQQNEGRKIEDEVPADSLVFILLPMYFDLSSPFAINHEGVICPTAPQS
jgi:hypothetical protein